MDNNSEIFLDVLKEFYTRNLTMSLQNSKLYKGKRYFKPCVVVLEGDYLSGTNILLDSFLEEVNSKGSETDIKYFDTYKEYEHLLRELVCHIVEAGPEADYEKLESNFYNFCNDDNINEFTVLLKNLGILDNGDLLYKSYRDKQKSVINSYKNFLEYYLEKFYSKNGTPKLFVIRNAEYIRKESVRIFMSIIRRLNLKEPIFFMFSYNSQADETNIKFLFKNRELLIDQSDEINLLRLDIPTKSTPLVKHIAEKFALKNPGYSVNDIISYSDSDIMIADELISFFIKDDVEIPDKPEYEDIVRTKISDLSADAKKLLDYIIFFDMSIEEEYLKYIFEDKHAFDITKILGELLKPGIAVLKQKVISLKNFRTYFWIRNDFDIELFLEEEKNRLENALNIIYEKSGRRNFAKITHYRYKAGLISKSVYFQTLITYYEHRENPIDLLLCFDEYSKDLTSDTEKANYNLLKLEALYELGKYQYLIAQADLLLKDTAIYQSGSYIVKTHILKGKSFRKLMLKPEFEKTMYKGFTLAKELKDYKKAGDILEELADNYLEEGDFSKAVSCYEDTIKNYKEIKAYNNLVRVYYKLSELYFNVSNFRKATDTLNLAMLYHHSLGKDSIVFGKITFLSGKLSAYQKDSKSSKESYDIAEKIFEKNFAVEELSKLYFSKSENYLANDEYDKATEMLKKSISLGAEGKSFENIAQIIYSIAKYNFAGQNIDEAKKLSVKGMKFCVKHGFIELLLNFIELTGDIAACENKFVISQRCYDYVFDRRSRIRIKGEIPQLLLKIAKIYATDRSQEKALKILERFKKSDYSYFLNEESDFAYNNILLESYIKLKDNKKVKEILKTQYELLGSKVLKVSDKMYFYYLAAIYGFTNDELESGEENYVKALTIAREEKLYLEEVSLQLKITELLRLMGFKRDCLSGLISLIPVLQKVNSKYLKQVVTHRIFEL